MNEASARQTMIEAAGLGRVYWDGDRALEIFKDISFKVSRGEGVAILGPSGSGKTTLLNLLSGLDTPSHGEVWIEGVPLGPLGERRRALFRNRHIGFVFQFYHLLAEFTALENVMLPARMARPAAAPARIRERAKALLERVGLRERLGHFPGELSGGEQQRVAIARALMNDPQILFCDEPTGNLDLKMGEEIADLLRRLHQEDRKTVLIVTHDPRIAKMTDRIWNMVDARWESR